MTDHVLDHAAGLLQAAHRSCCYSMPYVHTKQSIAKASPVSNLWLAVTGLAEVAVSGMHDKTACQDRAPVHAVSGINKRAAYVLLAACASDSLWQSLGATPSIIFIVTRCPVVWRRKCNSSLPCVLWQSCTQRRC